MSILLKKGSNRGQDYRISYNHGLKKKKKRFKHAVERREREVNTFFGFRDEYGML